MIHFVLVDFGEGSLFVLVLLVLATGGKTKSTPCPTWTGLLSLDWILDIFKIQSYLFITDFVPLLQSNPLNLLFP